MAHRVTMICAAAFLVPAFGFAGLLGYWDFDEGAGSYAQSRGSDHSIATFAGDAQWAPTGFGGTGSALQVDGTGDFALVGEGFVRPQNAFTYSFWFKPNAPIDAATPRKDLIYGVNGARPHLTFNKAGPPGAIGGYVNMNGGDVPDTNTPFTATTNWSTNWHHAALSFDGSNLNWYVDGVLESVTPTAGVHNVSTGMRIGGALGNQSLDGLMDDVAVFDTALADGGATNGQVAGGEVGLLYSNGPSAFLQMPYDLLFVVNNATNLNTADAAVLQRLTNALGLQVQTITASTSTTADADGVRGVVISSTLGSDQARGKFDLVPKGVFNWEEALFQNGVGNFRVSQGHGTVGGQTDVGIVNPAHPLAAGLTGTVAVTTAARQFSYGGAPFAPGADLVAVASTNANQGVIVAVDRYDELLNGVGTPGRRLSFFFGNTTANALTTNGWRLFDAGIDWILGEPPVADTLRIDFGADSPQDLQPGFQPFSRGPAAGINLPGPVYEVFPCSLGIDNRIAVGIDAENPAGSVDFRDRGNVVHPEGNLLEDHVKHQNGGLILTLTGLRAGNYRMVTWHHDLGVVQGMIDIYVNGVPVVTGLQTSGGAAVTNLARAAFPVSSDGTSDTTILFDNVPLTDAEVPLNGFILEPFQPDVGTLFIVK